MGGASSFYAMLFIAAFLFAVWGAGKLSRVIGVSSIVLEVAVGLILGPGVLNLIPRELSVSNADLTMDCSKVEYQTKIAMEDTYYCDVNAYVCEGTYSVAGQSDFFGTQDTVSLGVDCSASSGGSRRLSGGCNTYNLRQCSAAGGSGGSGGSRRLSGGAEGKTDSKSYSLCLEEMCTLKKALTTATIPDIFTLVGHTGVAMMIFESGMHFDFAQAKIVGPWASLVAVIGTLLPIIAGTALAMAFSFPFFPDACSAGVALAPTSVGIALTLLHEADALSTYFGQAVMTAAFVDDVLSLVLFSVLFSIGGGDVTFMGFFPLICGLVFMGVAIVAAVTVWPKVLTWVLSVVPETKPHAKLTRHDEVMWFIMFATLIAYAQITHLCGTHLWGCFIAGMSFATRHEAHHVWVRQVKKNTCWFLRIFFSCTLAWSIPVNSLFSVDAFWKGTLMGIGPCILTKVICGPFMGETRWVIGWAMVGRAEFAYFIAIMAKSLNMMSPDLFAILVWALIYATIFAPLIFREVLKRYMATQNGGESPKKNKVARCATGHLPDLVAEEKEAEERSRRERSVSLEEEMLSKDVEISRLKALVSSLETGAPAGMAKAVDNNPNAASDQTPV